MSPVNRSASPSASGKKAGSTLSTHKGIRKRGSGGIFVVREGVWRVDVEIARDALTGRRRRASRYVRGTREEAELALARLKIADHEKRLPTGGTSARSVSAALDLYQRTAETGSLELAPKTVVTSRSAIRVMELMVLPDGRTFGDIRLSRLTWQDIEHLYATMRATGRGRSGFAGALRAHPGTGSRSEARPDSTPTLEGCRPTEVRPEEAVSPAEADVREALATVADRDPELADIITVMASSGIRRGKLLGLQWGDVDLEAGEIHVAAAITDGGPGVGIIRKPTKRSDWRDVPLTKAAKHAIERQGVRFRELFGQDPPASSYVFGGLPDGSQAHRPDVLTHRVSEFRGTSSLTLLDLRHYVATAMLDAGESYRTVADILGNSEATLRLHYDGRTGIEKRKAIGALELQ